MVSIRRRAPATTFTESVVRGGDFSSRVLVEFEDVYDMAKEQIDFASMKIDVSSVSCGGVYEIVPLNLGEGNSVSESTWDCAHDSDNDRFNFISDCKIKHNSGSIITDTTCCSCWSR